MNMIGDLGYLIKIILIITTIKIKYSYSTDMCQTLIRDPSFDVEQIVGESWCIYHTWNMNISSKCLYITFRSVGLMDLKKVYNDMHEYIETQPVWSAATLHALMGPAQHEMMLFADQGAAGSFTAVPNVVRTANLLPQKHSVPLLKLHMKFLNYGQYLVLVDCTIGVASLSVRVTQSIRRQHITAIAGELGFGDGAPACTEKHDDFLYR